MTIYPLNISRINPEAFLIAIYEILEFITVWISIDGENPFFNITHITISSVHTNTKYAYLDTPTRISNMSGVL
jgi:hypothetical protein